MDYAVMTQLKVKPGKTDEVAELFRQTNASLVADQRDWKSARLLANRDENSITVIAIWSDPDSYRRYAAGPLAEAMKQFMPFFEGPPAITMHEVLVDM